MNTTKKMVESKFQMVNSLLEELGSEYRLKTVWPWSHEVLAIATKDHMDDACCIDSYAQSTKREINDTLRVVYDLLYRLQQEKEKKKEIES